MAVKQWMAWEGGVDLLALTQQHTQTPNVILHVARMVHTPVGSAPSGMVLWQPDSAAPPQLAAFISTDIRVGAYFGPHLFAGSLFENAPVALAQIEVFTELPHAVGARVTIPEISMTLDLRFDGIGAMQPMHREPGFFPFMQQGLEAAARSATLRINGAEIALTLPERTLSGSPAACWAPCGIYAR
jgi:hypothetical protein